MSFGPRAAAGKRNGSRPTPPAAGGAGRNDVQERLRELRSRQDAWMQQREHSLGAPAAVPDEAEPRKPPPRPRPQPQPLSQSQSRSQAPAQAAAGSGAGSGLLERVRVELEDIEREVRASAGLQTSSRAAPPPAAASSAASRTSAALAASGGLRPVSHFCPACGRLMLGGVLDPQLLSPCGHSVCAECAVEPTGRARSCCPHCGLRMAAIRPDAALRAAIGAFAGAGAAPATAAAPAADDSHGNGDSGKWLRQLDIISGRMRQLDASMEGLQAEVAQLTGQLEAEAARDRQLAASETAVRKEIERMQAELSSLAEQRSVSRDNQAFIQSEIDAKKEAIQGAFASQQLVSQELAKLQRLCAG